MQINYLTQANNSFRAKKFEKSIYLYSLALKNNTKLGHIINFNINLAEKKILERRNPIKTTAIVVHVFYEHLWDRINTYLKNLDIDFDLIVTTTEVLFDSISKKITNDYNSAIVFIVENEGMDVLPFIIATKKARLWEYSSVLKLHTKNDKTEEKAIHGKALLDSVIGSTEIASKAIRSIQHNDVGLIGAEIFFRSADLLMYNNREAFRNILKCLNLPEPESEFGFIAGTIFWIKGSLLKIFDEKFHTIYELLSSSKEAKTGGDGTYAHAMERFFGALPAIENLEIAVTYQQTEDTSNYSLRVIDNFSINENPIYRTGSGTHIIRYKNIQNQQYWTAAIKKSDLFNDEYYRNQLPINTIPSDQDSITHYLMHGDLFLANPSEKFNSIYYLTRYKDIARSREPALIHFINHGKREGRIGLPENEHWIELAFIENLLNTKWKENPSDLIELLKKPISKENLENVFSKNFNPYKIPKLIKSAKTKSSIDVVHEYLNGVYQRELENYDLLERTWLNQDIEKSKDIATTIKENYGVTRASLEILASCEILLKNWNNAEKLWINYWKLINSKQGIPERCKKTILRIDRPTDENNEDFQIINNSGFRKTIKSEERKSICIYTTLFGDIDDLLPIIPLKHDIDFICFTDRDRPSMGWNIRLVSPEFKSSNLSAKIYKILPHKYLKEYKYSLFVDANTLFLGRINLLINLCLNANDFVMWRHPFRRDIFKEYIAIVTSKRHEPVKLLAQIKKYDQLGLPNNTGLTEGSFIWRSHINKEVCNFMDDWWTEILNGSYRDQVSLGYLMWSTNLKPHVFSERLGSSRDNCFFVKVPHNFEAPQKQQITNTIKQNRNIVFLYSEKYAKSGSTVMRGEQLSKLIKNHYIERGKNVTYTSDSNQLKNCIIFITKGFLKDSSVQDLEKLKSHNNILLYDFVDDIPDKNKIDFADALIASSILGYKHYMLNIPQIPSFHLTHHVDPRVINKIKPTKLEFNSCEIGYFGELLNTQKTESIEKFVKFINVDTSIQDDSWIDLIPKFNCHYAVRQKRGIDGFKPFLKGFTAAASNSIIIIQANEGDAEYYLGSDYPYLVSNTPTEEEILSVIDNAKSDYNKSNWNYASEIMNEIKLRSSMDHIINEFDKIIKNF
ncbi:uncharacterized protein DUF616 [Azomonas agilis]|uniref:Uncharacterized protein DUF616 n=1 Tax=Azomonas agilis TaxID=116849 RepID=A0A562J1J0_9GAMM|nr:rhamnan synthesis F family protein [Azomonas agilis]TWH76704.1 uncharacterized protein DUF616 [Azomonas agilis]